MLLNPQHLPTPQYKLQASRVGGRGEGRDRYTHTHTHTHTAGKEKEPNSPVETAGQNTPPQGGHRNLSGLHSTAGLQFAYIVCPAAAHPCVPLERVLCCLVPRSMTLGSLHGIVGDPGNLRAALTQTHVTIKLHTGAARNADET